MFSFYLILVNVCNSTVGPVLKSNGWYAKCDECNPSVGRCIKRNAPGAMFDLCCPDQAAQKNKPKGKSFSHRNLRLY